MAVNKNGSSSSSSSDSTSDNSDNTTSSSFSSFSIGSLSDGGSTSSRTQYVSSTVPNPNSSSTSTYYGSVRVYVNSQYTSAEASYSSTSRSWVINNHPISLDSGTNSIYIAVYTTSGSLFEKSATWTVTGNFTQYPYRIELTWNTDDNDLDLHLVKDDSWTSTNHCYYSNKTTSFAQLDYDRTSGYGPENITILNSADTGEYDIYVKYYSGQVTATATVRIYKNGSLDATRTHSFYSSDVNTSTASYNSTKDWYVGTITFY